MSHMIGIYIGRYIDSWVYDSATRQHITFSRHEPDAACEYFARLLIATGAEPSFNNVTAETTVHRWLNRQPDRDDLRELMGLQEL